MFGALVAGLLGLLALGAYEATPAREQSWPLVWPLNSQLNSHGQGGLSFDPAAPHTVMFVHPHCPCTVASVEELCDVLRDTASRATLVVYEPANVDTAWVDGPLWHLAAQHPDQFTLVRDPEGKLARTFRAQASGTCLVYGADRRLRYAGGVTLSRGHRGANAGQTTLHQELSQPTPDHEPSIYPVFGCSIFSDFPSSGLTTGQE